MDVSIIIVTWNSRRDIERCLDSVFQHTTGLEYEVLVVDNGSTDGTLELVREKFQAVRVLTNATNTGFSKANNRGIRQSSGRFVLLLNADTELIENSIGKLRDFLGTNARIGACGATLIYPGGAPQWSYGYTPSLGRMLWITISGLLRTQRGRKEGAIAPAEKETSHPAEYVVGADLMVRREVLERTGLLDERFFAYLEDTDLCRRIWAAGDEVWYYSGTSVIHYIGETFAPAKARIYYTSMFRYLEKHHGHYRLAKLYLLAKFKIRKMLSRAGSEAYDDAALRCGVIRECGLEYPFKC